MCGEKLTCVEKMHHAYLRVRPRMSRFRPFVTAITLVAATTTATKGLAPHVAGAPRRFEGSANLPTL
jgi:hypothetical protein